MRFLLPKIFAFVAVAAFVANARPTVAADPAAGTAQATSAAAGCPSTTLFSSRDGKTYVATFRDGVAYTGTISASFYTATQEFAATIPISITKLAKDSSYRSTALAIVNTSAEPFEAVEFDFGGTQPTRPCIDRFRVSAFSSADGDVRAAYAELDPAQPPIPLLKVIGGSSALTCAKPYAFARVDGNAAQPVYPAMAQASGVTGLVSIVVTIAASGAVTDASIYRSSGSDLLDRSGLQAARATHYRPQIFRCMPVPSAYLFKAFFSAS